MDPARERVAYAVSYFARGSSRGTAVSSLRRLVRWRRPLSLPFALAVASGSAKAVGGRARNGRAPIVRLPCAAGAGAHSWRHGRNSALEPDPRPRRRRADEPAAREPEFTSASAAGSRPPCAVMLCEQTFLNAGPCFVKATEASGGAARGLHVHVLPALHAPLHLFRDSTSILPHSPAPGEAASRTVSAQRAPHASRDRGVRRLRGS